MADKLDKKELTEPDPLQLIFTRVRAFVEKHEKRLYFGAGILILILVLAGG